MDISSLYIDLNNLEQAQKYLNQASLLNPTSVLGHQGLVHLKQDQLQEAIALFQDALTHDDSPELHYYLGFAHYMNHELELAWASLSSIHTSNYAPLAQLIMTRILYQQHDLDQALNLLNTHILDYPHDAEALGLASLIHFDNDNEELALEFSQKALMLDPDLHDAQLVDVMLRLMTQETDVEEIKKLLQHSPHDSRLLFALASTYMTQGDFTSAITYYENTLEIHPEFYDCHIALAWCQLLCNELSDAHETYQNAILLADQYADGWSGLALIYALTNHIEKAEQLIVKAQSLQSECFLTEITQTILLTIKHPEQASTHLLNTLLNQDVPFSEKLALLVDEPD